MNLRFKIARTVAEKEAVFALRRKIFVREQGISAALDNDGKYEESIHLMAIDDEGKLLASGRLTIVESAGILSRMAVAQGYRGHSLGKQIVVRLEAIARERHVSHLSLSPHAFLEEFYSDLGYATDPTGKHEVGKYTLLTMSKRVH